MIVHGDSCSRSSAVNNGISIISSLKSTFLHLRVLSIAFVLVATLVMIPVHLEAQVDLMAKPQTRTVIAGIHYKNPPGGQRFLLGADYRDLWSIPIEVERIFDGQKRHPSFSD